MVYPEMTYHYLLILSQISYYPEDSQDLQMMIGSIQRR